ncbi:ABC transporter permease [bacterium]|nr:ABC transporter permease [bacterium]
MKNNILTIYKKEILEFLRDKRVLISTVVVPLLLFPLLMFGVSYFFSKQISKVSRETVYLGYDSIVTKKYLKTIFKPPLYVLKKTIKKNHKKALDDKEINFYIEIKEDKNILFNIYYDKSKQVNEIKYSKIKSRIEDYRSKYIKKELIKFNITELLDKIKIKTKNTATKKKMGVFLLAMFLPYLLIIVSITGATYVAIDVTVGEKERGTIETLLSSPASRREIVLGKYLSVTTISAMTALLAIVSVNISMLMFPQLNGVKFHMDLFTIFIVLLSILPISMIFSAIIFLVSSFAKTIKEAQSYIQPLISLIIIPSMASLFPGIDQTIPVALIPVVNISILIKNILYQEIKPLFLIITIGESLILLVIFIVLAFRAYEREGIVFSSE